MDLYFLTLDDVLEIHSDQIRRYGGKRGVRDQNLLLSALAQPGARYESRFLHETAYSKAAAYLYHICQNHPFIDGNKRVAAVSALMFLAMNELPIDYSEMELEQIVQSVAEGKTKKDEIAIFLSRALG